jgi:hypothetical protein
MNAPTCLLRRAAISAAITAILSCRTLACDCGTVYFLVSDQWGVRKDATSYSSFVLPLSNEQDKQDARTLIDQVQRFKNTPDDPFPNEPGSIVVAELAWGTDGMNRNHLVPGKPEWPWHVSNFVVFTPGAPEIFDGSPEIAHLVHFPAGFDDPGVIGFWDYTVTAELGSALCLHLTVEQGALRFRWTDLSTTAAYPGTDYAYTLQMRDNIIDQWVQVPGSSWPIRETEWMQPMEDGLRTRFYRVKAERMDGPTWAVVPRDSTTVFFRVDFGTPSEGRFYSRGPSSFVVPISTESDKRHARAVIQHFAENAGEPLPDDLWPSVIAAVAWNPDAVNRNHLLPGKPAWPWHVTSFAGFAPHTGEANPRGAVRMPERVTPVTGLIQAEAYVITAELGPALHLSILPAAEGFHFRWTDLSASKAYVGTNWVYTIESRQTSSSAWNPAPGADWPTAETEWIMMNGGDGSQRYYRLRAESESE